MLIFTLAATLSITPAFSVAEQANSKAKEMAVVSIPENARQIGDGVYDLGYKIHNGKIVQGTLFVFSDKEFAKPTGAGNSKVEVEQSLVILTLHQVPHGDQKKHGESLQQCSIGIDVTGIVAESINKW